VRVELPVAEIDVVEAVKDAELAAEVEFLDADKEAEEETNVETVDANEETELATELEVGLDVDMRETTDEVEFASMQISLVMFAVTGNKIVRAVGRKDRGKHTQDISAGASFENTRYGNLRDGYHFRSALTRRVSESTSGSSNSSFQTVESACWDLRIQLCNGLTGGH
jgi:hypothetical protein